jgi:hypothetical protein
MAHSNMPEENRKEVSSGRFDLDAMIERIIEEKDRERQQAERLWEVNGDEMSVYESASGVDDAQTSSDLVLDFEDRRANDGEAGGSRDALSHSPDGVSAGDSEYSENASEQGDLHGDPTLDSQVGHPATSHPSMTRQETIWWAMSFEELFQDARKKGFGKAGKESRKSGRVRIIKWLCAQKGITPYVVSSVTPAVEDTAVINRPVVRPTGAISHPEAILRTSDPALQLLINDAEKKYKKWPADKLLELAMQRSYQLLKDSKGKLPSKSISAMSNWLAAWDILKSPREKSWWLRDGV